MPANDCTYPSASVYKATRDRSIDSTFDFAVVILFKAYAVFLLPED